MRASAQDQHGHAGEEGDQQAIFQQEAEGGNAQAGQRQLPAPRRLQRLNGQQQAQDQQGVGQRLADGVGRVAQHDQREGPQYGGHNARQRAAATPAQHGAPHDAGDVEGQKQAPQIQQRIRGQEASLRFGPMLRQPVQPERQGRVSGDRLEYICGEQAPLPVDSQPDRDLFDAVHPGQTVVVQQYAQYGPAQRDQADDQPEAPLRRQGAGSFLQDTCK